VRRRRLLAAAAAAGLLALAPAEPAPGAADGAVRWVPAHPDNYTRRAARSVRRIVIHTIEGSEQAGISWFQDPRSRVSAHYVVGHGGRVTQMLRDRDIGWHAGNWRYNADSIGIENEGWAGRDGWTDAQYAALADLVRRLCDRHGIPKDRDHVIGHAEVPDQDHRDPGPHFDWDRLLRAVRGAAGVPDPPGVGPSRAAAVEITAAALNVRDAPWGAVVGQTRRGAVHATRARRGDWLQVDFGGRPGWISGAYARAVASPVVEVTAAALNARARPTTAAPRVGLLRAGQRYADLGRDGAWVRVQLTGDAAWVHGAYVRRP